MQLLQNAFCRSFHIQSGSAKGRQVGVWGAGWMEASELHAKWFTWIKKTNIKTEEESFMMHVCILTNANL